MTNKLRKQEKETRMRWIHDIIPFQCPVDSDASQKWCILVGQMVGVLHFGFTDSDTFNREQHCAASSGVTEVVGFVPLPLCNISPVGWALFVPTLLVPVHLFKSDVYVLITRRKNVKRHLNINILSNIWTWNYNVSFSSLYLFTCRKPCLCKYGERMERNANLCSNVER